jgi:Mrp family chromosome partitioning ATPase
VSTLVETRTQLLNRRAEIVIDAGATDVGIVASSPAPLPKKTGSGEVIRFAALGAIVGLLPAAVVAYLVALRRRRFDDRFVPEQIIERPLLSEIPDFASEHLKTHVPARDAPFSAAAEGYRFASSALSVLASDARSVAVVSASEGDGKSISAANLAWTAAAEGRRVLAVDADFEGRALTQLLLGSPLTDASGLLQLIDGRKSRREVLHQVHVNDKATLDLLPSGYGVSRAGDALSSPTGREVFRRLAEQYDLVIVDTPPLLQVAYAASIVTELDLALLVVPHHSPVPRTEELVKRLNYLGVEPVGYLYTKAPLRPGLGVHSQLVDDRPGTSPRAAAPDLEPGGQGRTVTPAR